MSSGEHPSTSAPVSNSTVQETPSNRTPFTRYLSAGSNLGTGRPILLALPPFCWYLSTEDTSALADFSAGSGSGPGASSTLGIKSRPSVSMALCLAPLVGGSSAASLAALILASFAATDATVSSEGQALQSSAAATSLRVTEANSGTLGLGLPGLLI